MARCHPIFYQHRRQGSLKCNWIRHVHNTGVYITLCAVRSAMRRWDVTMPLYDMNIFASFWTGGLGVDMVDNWNVWLPFNRNGTSCKNLARLDLGWNHWVLQVNTLASFRRMFRFKSEEFKLVRGFFGSSCISSISSKKNKKQNTVFGNHCMLNGFQQWFLMVILPLIWRKLVSVNDALDQPDTSVN